MSATRVACHWETLRRDGVGQAEQSDMGCFPLLEGQCSDWNCSAGRDGSMVPGAEMLPAGVDLRLHRQNLSLGSAWMSCLMVLQFCA